jgi:hypothetical protein
MNTPQQVTLAVLISLAAVVSAHAETFPSDHSPVGGALAARVIGETCPDALTSAETAEIGRYVDRVVAVEKAKSPEEKTFMERLVPALEADYRSNRTCGVGDVELAKDMLLRVRKEVENIR